MYVCSHASTICYRMLKGWISSKLQVLLINIPTREISTDSIAMKPYIKGKYCMITTIQGSRNQGGKGS